MKAYLMTNMKEHLPKEVQATELWQEHNPFYENVYT